MGQIFPGISIITLRESILSVCSWVWAGGWVSVGGSGLLQR